jgi:hypothetical protein
LAQFIPTPGTVKLEIRQELDGQKIENTLWFHTGGTVDSGSMAALATAVRNWWNGQVRTLLTVSLITREVYVTSQESNSAPTYSTVANLPSTGAVNAIPTPNQCALVISFRTAARGRGARGRNYVAGLPQSTLNSNDYDTSTVNALQTAYNSLIGVAADAGWEWVVVSHYDNKVPRIAGLGRPVISALCVDPTVDSQRRRAPGRGK